MQQVRYMIYPLKTIVLKLLTVRLPQTSPFTHSSHNMITGMKSVLTFDSRHQTWHCCLNVRDMKMIQQKCGQNVMKTHETRHAGESGNTKSKPSSKSFTEMGCIMSYKTWKASTLWMLMPLGGSHPSKLFPMWTTWPVPTNALSFRRATKLDPSRIVTARWRSVAVSGCGVEKNHLELSRVVAQI